MERLLAFSISRKEKTNIGRNKRGAPPPTFMTALPHKGFVQMFNDQLNSPTFISLSNVAKVMYLILRQEFKGDYTGNNIICPYNTFIEKGISRNYIPYMETENNDVFSKRYWDFGIGSACTKMYSSLHCVGQWSMIQGSFLNYFESRYVR